MSDPALTLDIRPARPEDRDPVLAFCADTWPDGDYIPAVWDEWLADTEGALLVAVAGNRPLGLIHLRMMSPDEGWIEGIRVDPAARRQGIARVLLSRALVAARERGASVVRLFTDHDNLPAQGLFAHFGFTRIAETVRYHAPALDGAPETLADPTHSADLAHPASPSAPSAPPPGNASSLQPAPAGAWGDDEDQDDSASGARVTMPGDDQFERIWDWLVQSNLAPLTGGLEFDGWTARAFTEPSLRAALAAGEVLLLEQWETILALAVVQDFPGTTAEPPTLDVRYIDGLSESIGRLALVLREVAQERNLSRVTLWLPNLLILHDAMDGAGYTAESSIMWTYGRRL